MNNQRLNRSESRVCASIIISVSNEDRYLDVCLKSIKKNTCKPYEIIFINNCLKGRNLKQLRRLIDENINYMLIKREKRSSIIKYYNDAIRKSCGENIVLLHSDVVVSDCWLSHMLECLKKDSKAGLVGPMSNGVDGIQTDIRAKYDFVSDFDEYAKKFKTRNRFRIVPAKNVAGFCVLSNRRLIEDVGEFDANYYSEELMLQDYCLRARLAGYRNVIASDVLLHHFKTDDSDRKEQIDSVTAGKKTKDRRIFKEKWGHIDLESGNGKKLLALNAIEKGDELNQKGNIDGAVDMILKGIGYSPDDKRIYFFLSEILINAGNFKGALDTLDTMPDAGFIKTGKTGKMDEEDIRKLELAGFCFEGLKRDDKAYEYANRVLSAKPDSAPALNLQGVLAYNIGDKKKAEDFYIRAIESDPGYGEPYMNLGTLKCDLDEKDKALDLYERGFILSADIIDIATIYHSFISALGSATGTYERSCKIVMDAASLYPRNKKLKYLLVDLYIKQERYDLAMKEIEDAIIQFGIDDGILIPALKVRRVLGPEKINPTSKKNGTVSLCMIVKNEEQHLAKCLVSAKPVVDEMIVVDTGSTDKTKEIAEAFGARVYDIKWTNDFSEARNFSLSKALGSWIFVLDGDEMVSPLDYKNFRRIVNKSRSEASGYRIMTRNYTADSTIIGWTANDGKYIQEEAGNGWIPTYKVRLFPSDSRIRYKYPVHEMLEPSLKKAGIQIKKCSIPVHHYGKLNRAKSEGKGEIYYQLGRKKLEETGDDIFAIRELAIQAGILEKHEEAVELWQRFIAIEPHVPEAYVNMATSCLLLGKYDDALIAAKKAVLLAPYMNESLYNYAIIEIHMGNAGEAIPVLEELLKRSPEYMPALLVLTCAYFCDGRNEEGMEGFKKLKKTPIGPVLSVSIHTFANGLVKAGQVEYALLLLDAAIEANHVNGDMLSFFSECLKMKEDFSRMPRSLISDL